MRRVDGAVRFAQLHCTGDDDIQHTLYGLDGQRVGPYVIGATHSDALPWNRWVAIDAVSDAHMTNRDLLWAPLGITHRLMMSIVDPRERTVGTLLLMSRQDLGGHEAIQRIAPLTELLTRTFLSADREQLAEEPIDQAAALVLHDDGRVEVCEQGALLWDSEPHRLGIERLLSELDRRSATFCGNVWVSARRLADAVTVWALPSTTTEAAPVGQFNPSERKVAELMVTGLSNSEIAARIGRSVETVRTHARSVMQILGVTNRAEAATLLLQVPWR